MKLLGWMHRKLMHNSTSSSIDQIKNPTIAAATSFNQQNYFTESESPTIKFEESFEFLSIGTFGVELINTEPLTPTLPMEEEEEDEHIEITENDLNLINQELEKFLDAEETEFNNDSSQRSSHASVITLSYKPMSEGSESEGHIHMAACPLQSYLLAASVETEKEVKKERASLGELFKRSNAVQEEEAVIIKKCEVEESRKGNVGQFMKKVVKKFHSLSSSETAPTKNKLSKNIVKMFHKKVYPEEMTEKQFMKVAKNRSKSISHENTHTQSKPKKKTIKLSLAGICRGASPVNAGHWIKTDSDYLVLEL